MYRAGVPLRDEHRLVTVRRLQDAIAAISFAISRTASPSSTRSTVSAPLGISASPRPAPSSSAAVSNLIRFEYDPIKVEHLGLDYLLAAEGEELADEGGGALSGPLYGLQFAVKRVVLAETPERGRPGR